MSAELFIEAVFKNTSLIGLFFLIGGVVKLFTYYKLFGVYIFEFIDIKEVVTLFLNNLLAFLTLLFVITFLLISHFHVIGFYSFIAPFAFSVIALLYYFIRRGVYFYEIILQIVFFWVLFAVVNYLTAKINFERVSNKVPDYNILLGLFLFLILYSIANAINEFYKVKYRQYYSKASIIFKDRKFDSSIDKYYIGKTDKFIFIYDSIHHSSEITQVSDVKSIVFQERKI